MIKFSKVILFSTVLMLAASAAIGQKMMIAHVNYDSVLASMPEMDTVRNKAQNFVKQLETQLTSMQNDLQTKYQDYQLHVKDYTELIKGVKEKEMQDLQQRIQDFQQTAQQEIQKENERLIKPVNDRAHKAIKEVANEKGYKLVLDSGLESVLYSEPSDDILPLVKVKLKTMK